MKECGWRGSPDPTAASNAANAAAVSPLAHATSISRLAACPGLGAKFCGRWGGRRGDGARQGRRVDGTMGARGERERRAAGAAAVGKEPGGAGVASNGVERRVRGRGRADLLALPVPVAAAPIAVVSFLSDVGHGAWGAEAPARPELCRKCRLSRRGRFNSTDYKPARRRDKAEHRRLRTPVCTYRPCAQRRPPRVHERAAPCPKPSRRPATRRSTRSSAISAPR